jgi:galactoside O-acetyltransferase
MLKGIIRLVTSPLMFIGSVILFFVTYLPGGSGNWLRYRFYRKRFKSCGKNVIFSAGILIEGAKYISIGDNIWFDKYCIISAGPVNLEDCIIKKRENHRFTRPSGNLVIGSGVHIGAFNIIQAHGGVEIGNNVTTSAGVKIYSLSNFPCDQANPAKITYANCMVKESDKVSYIVSPIVIEDGVWIALNSLVLGGTIGKNSFIASQSLVLDDIDENSYASGNPARKIKNRFEAD